jgi:hypothetical protein
MIEREALAHCNEIDALLRNVSDRDAISTLTICLRRYLAQCDWLKQMMMH